MKKKINFSGIAMLCLSAILLLTQCSKSITGTSTLPPSGPGLPPPVTISKCPFDCHDARCRSYINYCGFNDFTLQTSVLNSAAVTGTMTRAFESQNINWAVLSTAAGLPSTIQESDIDFQNLNKSYNANDLTNTVAYSAPFKSNSTTGGSNYLFTLYSTDGVCFFEPMIIKIKKGPDVAQYFDLTSGSVLSVNNFDSASPSTSIDSSGSFLNNSVVFTASGPAAPVNKMTAVSYSANLNPAWVGNPCGQKTMNCLSDVYNNHGWISVWVTVQSAFIPATVAVFAAGCAAKNCLASTKADQACYN